MYNLRIKRIEKIFCSWLDRFESDKASASDSK